MKWASLFLAVLLLILMWFALHANSTFISVYYGLLFMGFLFVFFAGQSLRNYAFGSGVLLLLAEICAFIWAYRNYASIQQSLVCAVSMSIVPIFCAIYAGYICSNRKYDLSAAKDYHKILAWPRAISLSVPISILIVHAFDLLFVLGKKTDASRYYSYCLLLVYILYLGNTKANRFFLWSFFFLLGNILGIVLYGIRYNAVLMDELSFGVRVSIGPCIMILLFGVLGYPKHKVACPLQK